ncbi:MAG: carbonic anhydrase [Desulfomonilaceae bacterium]
MEKPRIIPDQAIGMLKRGNSRYMSGGLEHPHLGQARRTLTAMQGRSPFAAVLSCSDSRVPVELIFDCGIGDIFVIRVAGNVLGNSELGSLEYAVDHIGVSVVLVLGHTKCGAVKAVCESGVLEGNLRGISEKILLAVQQVDKSSPGLSVDQKITEAGRANVWNSIQLAFMSSKLIRRKVLAEELRLIGAFYDIETGEVRWMGNHPDQDRLLRSTSGNAH